MKYLTPRTLLLLMVLSPSLPAATISGDDTTALLHSGDALAFEVLSWNFGYNAARYGLPAFPTEVSFTFVTAPVRGQARFSAWLESPDGSASVPFAGPLFFTPGLLSSRAFSGTVSILEGYIHLAPPVARAIFDSGSARLLLVNDGPDITLGLPPKTLQDDLRLSLTRGPLSVGALTGNVGLESVPEPALTIPILFGMVILGVRGRRILNSKSYFRHLICQPAFFSDIIKTNRSESVRLKSANLTTELKYQPE